MEKHGFQQVLNLSGGLLSVRCALKIPQRGARRSHPNQMPEQPQLFPFNMYKQWLDLSLPQISELLTLSLRLSPASLRRKLILASCGRDLILTVTTQTSERFWLSSLFTTTVQHDLRSTANVTANRLSILQFISQSIVNKTLRYSNPLFSSREPWPQSKFNSSEFVYGVC